MSDPAAQIAIGIEEGKVILRFQKNVNWMKLDPDVAVAIGDKLIASGIQLGVYVEMPQAPKAISLGEKIALEIRVSNMLKQLHGTRMKPDRIAREVVETVLRAMECQLLQ